MEGYLIFLTIGTIANLCLTGWVMLAVNETDRTNTRMIVDSNTNLDYAIGLVRDDVREMCSDIRGEIDGLRGRAEDDTYD